MLHPRAMPGALADAGMMTRVFTVGFDIAASVLSADDYRDPVDSE